MISAIAVRLGVIVAGTRELNDLEQLERRLTLGATSLFKASILDGHCTF